mmetsp:Transcript_7405/g.24626  ORF Transcript_7405/g.24626 Transcript_7405/m.24626 type:complete len:234 (+) Transcript_7405:1748-2449(+)
MPITFAVTPSAAHASLTARCGSLTMRQTSVSSSERHACGRGSSLGFTPLAPRHALGIRLVATTRLIGVSPLNREPPPSPSSPAAPTRATWVQSASIARITCCCSSFGLPPPPLELAPADAAAAAGAAAVAAAAAAPLAFLTRLAAGMAAGAAAAEAGALRFLGAAAASATATSPFLLTPFFFFLTGASADSGAARWRLASLATGAAGALDLTDLAAFLGLLRVALGLGVTMSS